MTEAFLLSSARVGVAGCVESGDGVVSWSLSIRGGRGVRDGCGGREWWARGEGKKMREGGRCVQLKPGLSPLSVDVLPSGFWARPQRAPPPMPLTHPFPRIPFAAPFLLPGLIPAYAPLSELERRVTDFDLASAPPPRSGAASPEPLPVARRLRSVEHRRLQRACQRSRRPHRRPRRPNVVHRHMECPPDLGLPRCAACTIGFRLLTPARIAHSPLRTTPAQAPTRDVRVREACTRRRARTTASDHTQLPRLVSQRRRSEPCDEPPRRGQGGVCDRHRCPGSEGANARSREALRRGCDIALTMNVSPSLSWAVRPRKAPLPCASRGRWRHSPPFAPFAWSRNLNINGLLLRRLRSPRPRFHPAYQNARPWLVSVTSAARILRVCPPHGRVRHARG